MTSKSKKMTRYNSTPFPACFRPSTTTPALEYHHAPPPTTHTTTTPNLTTCLFQTHLGLFSSTWSRSLLARTLHLHLHPSSPCSPPLSLSSPSFHLTLKPFAFWSKQGLKKLPYENNDPLTILWDFTNAKFGPGPEPESGYYIAVVSGSTTALFVGDMYDKFQSMARSKKLLLHNGSTNNKKNKGNNKQQPLLIDDPNQSTMVVRREHMCGNRFYTTRTTLGDKSRVILIELVKSDHEDEPRLTIKFDNKRVISVKHLKWKFRGSERVEVDGHRIQLSWDVYNWLFEEEGNNDEAFALFTFRFEKPIADNNHKNLLNDDVGDDNIDRKKQLLSLSERAVMWSQDSCGLSYERKKMKKKLLVKTRSGSSSSLSSASSASSNNSSVMEWESVEENALKGPTGFSLLVYAWKS